MLVRYKDRDETITSGEAFYMAPGYLLEVIEDTYMVIFCPEDEDQRTIDIIERNMARG